MPSGSPIGSRHVSSKVEDQAIFIDNTSPSKGMRMPMEAPRDLNINLSNIVGSEQSDVGNIFGEL